MKKLFLFPLLACTLIAADVQQSVLLSIAGRAVDANGNYIVTNSTGIDANSGGTASTNNAGFSQVSAGQFTTNGNTLGLHQNVTNDLAAAMRAELAAAIATNGLATNWTSYTYLTNFIANDTPWTNTTGYPLTLHINARFDMVTAGPISYCILFLTNVTSGHLVWLRPPTVTNTANNVDFRSATFDLAPNDVFHLVASSNGVGVSVSFASFGVIEKIHSRAIGDVLEVDEVTTPILNVSEKIAVPLMTNVAGILLAIQTPPITVSNILVSFATNSYEFYGTNFIGTNIVKLPTGVRGKATIIIRPWAVATPALLPSFGSGASGIFWHTNGLPDAYFKMLTEGAPPGTNTVIEIEQWGTNSYPGFTQWRHP